mmetsp:Transcript_970/g.1389  ORF Transcript_970/g.1389 Transcript_970/m.1389 type:complete len:94 (-) Transcript_970:703-984(-)
MPEPFIRSKVQQSARLLGGTNNLAAFFSIPQLHFIFNFSLGEPPGCSNDLAKKSISDEFRVPVPNYFFHSITWMCLQSVSMFLTNVLNDWQKT